MNLEAKNILDDLAGSVGVRLEAGSAKLEHDFFDCPTHADGAQILFTKLKGEIIFERLSQGRGNFWRRTGAGYFEPVDDIYKICSETLCDSINSTLAELLKTANAKTVKSLYETAGAAFKRAKTKDFLAGVLAFFAELVFEKALPAAWNSVQQCLPCTDAVLDFSGSEPLARPARPGEFFRDPLPVRSADILNADVAPQFELYLLAVAPDAGVRKTLRELLSLAVANRGHRTIGLFTGPGSNGKSLLAQILMRVLPGRITELASAAISRDMTGAKRFAAAELEHKTFAFVEEQQAPLDTSELKRLAGDAPIAVERKGQDPCEIPQSWALAILSNGLPSFAPATDAAFVSRLIVVPFEVSFYASEEQRLNFLKLGVPEDKLRPAEDKEAILAHIEEERSAILKNLIQTWIRIRDENKGRPSEAPKCVALKNAYRSSNDKIEEFFTTYFERAEGCKVSYDEILSLYRDYFNDKSISTRDCIKKLTDRFPWLERGRTKNTLYLKNMRIINSLPSDKEPKDDSQNNNGDIEDNENPLFQLGYRKIVKNPIAKLKNQNSLSPISQDDNLPLESDPAFADAEVCYLNLLQLHDERMANLRTANLDTQNARVEISAWRQHCGAMGIPSERFEQARAVIDKLGMAKTDGIYIEPVEAKNE